MEKEIIQVRVTKDTKKQFKHYCIDHETTMSKVLMDYISILLPGNKTNSVDPPPEEKNSVKDTPDTPKYMYCACGLDLMTLLPQDRLLHVQKCADRRKSAI